MIAAIEQWLHTGQDFDTGVILIHKYSSRSLLKRMLESGDTDFNREKVLEELIFLNQQEEKKKEPVVVRKAILSEQEYQLAPDNIRAIEKQAKDLFKENARRHAELATMLNEALKQFPNDLKRQEEYLTARNAGDIGNVILDVDDEIAALFYKIDYWKVHKKLPEDLSRERSQQDLPDLMQALSNIRSRISKEKRKCKDDPSAKLKFLQVERDSIESKINGLI